MRAIREFFQKSRWPVFGSQSGFTVVEMAVVIGIIGIMAAVAIPNILNGVPDRKLKQAARDMVSNLHRAKLEAVKRGAVMAVAFGETVNGTTFDYVIFQDDDADLEYDAGENVLVSILLNRYRGVRMDQAAENSFPLNGLALKAFGFSSRALPVDSAGNILVGNVGADNIVTFVNTNAHEAEVMVNTVGRVRLQIKTDNNDFS